jgi:hypothetical protein
VHEKFSALKKDNQNAQAVIEALSSMNQNVFDKLNLFIQAYDSYFLSTKEPLKNAAENIGTGLKAARKLFWKKLSFEARYQAQQELLKSVSDIENDYFKIIDSLLVLPVRKKLLK